MIIHDLRISSMRRFYDLGRMTMTISRIDTGTMRAYQITAMIGDSLLVGGGLAADGVSIFHDCSIFDFHNKVRL